MPSYNPELERLIREAGGRLFQIADMFGCRRKGNRCVAIWRKGKDLNVSLNRDKGAFFDHVDNTGGGVIRFVELCANLTKREAIEWLSEFTGITLTERTAEERAEFTRRRNASVSEATEFATWKRHRLSELSRQRNAALYLHHGFNRLIIRYSLEDPEGDYWADCSEKYEERYLQLDARLDEIRNPEYLPTLVQEFRSERRH
jgi:hypothetical protein